MNKDVYLKKLRGALYGRCAGCTLGAPIEGYTSHDMESYAAEIGDAFPLENYITKIRDPERVRYIYQTFGDYTRSKINCVPCDDDVAYTVISLLIVERGGKNFTLETVKDIWMEYLTECYTAERVALDNLNAGVPAEKAAEINNPYDEFIGADIRCDGYGYMSPGNPAKAADMAETDARISHRNNGVYGSRYFAAVIASAFETNDVKTALINGLDYIPEDSELAKGLRWAVDIWDKVGDYKNAMRLVDERYPGMHNVHTINNACLTIFGLAIAGKDFTKLIGHTVAMAHDCDCTAATAGSIFGAAYGIDAIPEHWYKPFNGKIKSFLNGPKEYSAEDIIARFAKQAEAE